MASILKGDIVWAVLDPVRGNEQGGTRPVVILSEDLFNAKSGTVIAMALTSQEPKAGYPLSMELKSPKLRKRSWVKISQIRTLSVDRIERKIGRITLREHHLLVHGLNEIFGAPVT